MFVIKEGKGKGTLPLLVIWAKARAPAWGLHGRGILHANGELLERGKPPTHGHIDSASASERTRPPLHVPSLPLLLPMPLRWLRPLRLLLLLLL